MGSRLCVHGLQQIGMEQKLLDQLPPPRKFERRDLQAQMQVEFIDGAIDAAVHPSADGRRKQAINKGDDRQYPRRDGEPKRNCHRRCPVLRSLPETICQLACKPGSV
jgi:hypothetical protein